MALVLVPAFYETPEISARFSQAFTALLEASTPPYAVVKHQYTVGGSES